jgi:hypothetical protein
VAPSLLRVGSRQSLRVEVEALMVTEPDFALLLAYM